MSIHGHATIELTDVNTGEVEVVESDNIFTNAYRDMVLVPYRGNLSPQFWNYSEGSSYNITTFKTLPFSPIYIYGGLLCFNDILEEDADNYAFPSEKSIVARATQCVYSGTDSTIGNPNHSETKEVSNGVKFVWDFSTDKGNGDISTICLTTPLGAGIANGFKSDSDETLDLVLTESGQNAIPMATSLHNSIAMSNRCIFYILDLLPAMKKRDALMNVKDYRELSINGVWYADGINKCFYVLATGNSTFTNNGDCGESFKDTGYIRFHKFKLNYNEIDYLNHNLCPYIDDVIIEMPESLKQVIQSKNINIFYGARWSEPGYIHLVFCDNDYAELTGFSSYSREILRTDLMYHVKINMDDYSVSYTTFRFETDILPNMEAINSNEALDSIPRDNRFIGGIGDCLYYNSYAQDPDLQRWFYFYVEYNMTTKKIRVLDKSETYTDSIGYGTIKCSQVDGKSFQIYGGVGTKSYLCTNGKITAINGISLLASFYPYQGSGWSAKYTNAIPIWEGTEYVKRYLEIAIGNKLPDSLNEAAGDTTIQRFQTFSNASESTPVTDYSCFVSIRTSARNLFTINRLPKVITKTSDKTMKITYTLYEE